MTATFPGNRNEDLFDSPAGGGSAGPTSGLPLAESLRGQGKEALVPDERKTPLPPLAVHNSTLRPRARTG
jgi:hypothetical protein